ncbi:MAG: carboxypeptidase-like regulatory domain-containing protein [Ignavibacteria bacterium]|nr:carboxypeptidase-like regulatory domain-containing protein [Ignavibacteria bacterium]
MENFLKRLIIFSFLLIVIGINCFSQTHGSKLSGVVLDSETGQPIQYATVFIAFTSKGCLTDEKGEFIITNVAEGKYEVVCAAVGYEKITTNHTLKTGTEINVTYKLKPVPIQVNEINITASVPEDWEDNLLKFTKEFLGESSLSEQCTITNPEVLDFEIRDYTLIASSKKPLYVVNNALGFKVTVFVKCFEWDMDYDKGKFAYEPYFENLICSDINDSIRWSENRKVAYLGSFRHFLKSCAAKDAFDNGFKFILYEKDNNSLGWKKKLIPSRFNWQSKADFDSALSSIMRRVSNHQFNIETDNRLAVFYTKNNEDPNYKWYKERVYGTKEIKSYQTSYLNLFTGKLLFNDDGNILDGTMFNTILTGYWAWKRVSDLLPTDYEPNL